MRISLRMVMLGTGLVMVCSLGAAKPMPALPWTHQPSWLANPTLSSAVTNTSTSTRFTVGEGGGGMKWSAQLPQPVDLSKTPWVVIRYRAVDALPPADYFVHLGGNGAEQRIALPSDLIADGAWHTLIARANPFTASLVAIHLQAAGPRAEVELARLEFASEPPKLALEEVLAIGQAEPGDFKPIDLGSMGNAKSQSVADALGLAGWFSREQVAVSGVPFTIRKAELDVVATDPDKASEVRIALSGNPCSEIFLLAAVTGSAGTGALGASEPHQFSARVVYAAGEPDECIPARIPSGFGLAPGFAIYAIGADRIRPVKELVIRENVTQAVLNLVAVTLGADTRLAPHARPVEVQSPKSYSLAKASPIRKGLPVMKVAPDGSRLVILDGAHQAILSLRPGIALEITSAKSSGSLITRGSLWRVRTWGQELLSSDFIGTVKETDRQSAVIEVADQKGQGLSGWLTVQQSSSEGLSLKLDLGSQEKRRVQVFFPTLPEIRQTEGADLSYCFPRRGAVINHIPIDLREAYSGSMPLQFMDVYGPEGGLYLLTQDREDIYRYFLLRKSAGKVSMGVEYLEGEVDSTNRFVSPATLLALHPGDWHTAFEAYKDWVKTWAKPDAPRKDWFRRIFNFRQQFLRFYIPGGERYYDKQTKMYSFAEGIAEDQLAFGGVDYLHLFDWGASEKWGRTGDYEPWPEIGGLDAFREAVTATQASGIPVGLYIEGYLVEPQSRIGQAHGKEWELRGADGKGLPYFAPAMNMCSAVSDWQDYLASVYARVRQQTGALGYYCDEMGFADPGHFCYATNHGHGVPEPPLRGQRELLRKVRQSLGPEAALYTEETPCDANTPHQDGSFTYAVSSVADAWSPSHLNLTRFALPDFKTFEIIICDQPLGDRMTAVRQVFFNGEGIWLEGPADKWFAPEVREFIQKMHHVMRDYADCFTSLTPVPLVPTGNPLVFANSFPGDKRTLWTLFNANFSTVRGDLLALPHRAGSQYLDVWRQREVKPRIRGGLAYLLVEIGPRDVGCVVQKMP